MTIRQKESAYLTSSDHNPDQGGVICARIFIDSRAAQQRRQGVFRAHCTESGERLQTRNRDLTDVHTPVSSITSSCFWRISHVIISEILGEFVECSPHDFSQPPLSFQLHQTVTNSTRFPLASKSYFLHRCSHLRFLTFSP